MNLPLLLEAFTKPPKTGLLSLPAGSQSTRIPLRVWSLHSRAEGWESLSPRPRPLPRGQGPARCLARSWRGSTLNVVHRGPGLVLGLLSETLTPSLSDLTPPGLQRACASSVSPRGTRTSTLWCPRRGGIGEERTKRTCNPRWATENTLSNTTERVIQISPQKRAAPLPHCREEQNSPAAYSQEPLKKGDHSSLTLKVLSMEAERSM